MLAARLAASRPIWTGRWRPRDRPLATGAGI